MKPKTKFKGEKRGKGGGKKKKREGQGLLITTQQCSRETIKKKKKKKKSVFCRLRCRAKKGKRKGTDPRLIATVWPKRKYPDERKKKRGEEKKEKKP